MDPQLHLTDKLTELESMVTAMTTEDPIKRMIWSLVPDNRTRYANRFKKVLDSWLTKPEDGPEAFREAAIKFVKMVRENPELVEDRLRNFITSQYQRVQDGEIKPITIRNYIKAVKLFCESNRIGRFIEWKTPTISDIP